MELYEGLRHALGLNLGPKEVNPWQMCLRALIVFVAALVITRLAHKRFLSKMTAFDAILAFILGSTLSRAINGSAPFFPTLLAGLLLVLLHRACAVLAFHFESFGALIKGKPCALIRDGEMLPESLRAKTITPSDLLEELRLNGSLDKIEKVKEATMERSGQISIIPRKHQE
jgi:uncharacterized membrane protein YcaP (DUF421 family)